MSCSSVVVSVLSLKVCDGERPSKGLSKGTSAGMRRPSTGESGCDIGKEDWVDAGMLLTRLRRCPAVGPTACASVGNENSELKSELLERVDIVSAI